MLGPLSIKDWGPAVQVAHSSLDEQRVPHAEDLLATPTLRGFRCYSPCPRLATGAPWYIGNRHIDEDLVVLFFADHIRALNESFDKDI